MSVERGNNRKNQRSIKSQPYARESRVEIGVVHGLSHWFCLDQTSRPDFSRIKSLASPVSAKLDRKYEFWFLIFQRSNSVKLGLAKILTRDWVSKDYLSLNSRSPYPTGVGGLWNPEFIKSRLACYSIRQSPSWKTQQYFLHKNLDFFFELGLNFG